jgi:hypothetical protein
MFIPGAAKILRLLTYALKGSQKKLVEWVPEIQAAFQVVKAALCTAGDED